MKRLQMDYDLMMHRIKTLVKERLDLLKRKMQAGT
jgi:hypothetical protein